MELFEQPEKDLDYEFRRDSKQRMKPLVAIVGRPNVGKSTLFNKLLGGRKAIVHDMPGVTRDLNYGDVEEEGRAFTLVDTGGFETGEDVIIKQVREQARCAVEDADVIVFVMDGKSGPMPGGAGPVQGGRRPGGDTNHTNWATARREGDVPGRGAGSFVGAAPRCSPPGAGARGPGVS